MLVIRLFRTGKKNQPFFKIVVTDKRKPPRGGRFVEEVGHYNPLTKQNKLNGDRIKYWLSVGAKASDTIHNLLVKEKIIEGSKISSHKIVKKEEKSETAVPKEKPAEEQKAQEPKKEELQKPEETAPAA